MTVALWEGSLQVDGTVEDRLYGCIFVLTLGFSCVIYLMTSGSSFVWFLAELTFKSISFFYVLFDKLLSVLV